MDTKRRPTHRKGAVTKERSLSDPMDAKRRPTHRKGAVKKERSSDDPLDTKRRPTHRKGAVKKERSLSDPLDTKRLLTHRKGAKKKRKKRERSSGRQRKPIVKLTMTSMLDEIPASIHLREPEIESDRVSPTNEAHRSYVVMPEQAERPEPLPSKTHQNL